MNTRFEYEALPVFVPFHQSAARTRLIIGGYGSGKSHALCAEAIGLGLEHPGAEFLVMRKTVPALKATTEKIFLSLLPPAFLAACTVQKAGGHLDYVQFPNGSLYYFRGCDDWRKHRSMNLAFIVWDEADEFTMDDFDGLQSRLRQVHPTPQAKDLGYKRIHRNGNLLACNPQGHNWIWQCFINEAGELYRHKAQPEYWVSTSFDNPYLPVETLNDWLAMPDPWVRRYVLCSFDEFAGAIYSDFSWQTHVIDPFKDSTGAYLYDKDAQSWHRMGMDPGTHAPTAAVWIYNDYKKHRIVAVAEYAESGLDVAKHAQAWRRIELTHGMRVSQRLADPKAVTQRDRGSTMRLSDQYRRKGFHFQLGPGDIETRLWGLGSMIAQGRFFVSSECPRLAEQLANYRWEDLTPTQMERGKEARPLKKDVDIVDAAQYAVSKYVPKDVPAVETDYSRDAEIHAAIRRQLQRRRSNFATSRGEFNIV